MSSPKESNSDGEISGSSIRYDQGGKEKYESVCANNTNIGAFPETPTRTKIRMEDPIGMPPFLCSIK